VPIDFINCTPNPICGKFAIVTNIQLLNHLLMCMP
jgi:hypothetical protein